MRKFDYFFVIYYYKDKVYANKVVLGSKKRRKDTTFLNRKVNPSNISQSLSNPHPASLSSISGHSPLTTHH